MKLSNYYYETFYGYVFLVSWIVIPAIIGIFLTVFFHRMTKKSLYHKKEIEKLNWCVKWGYTWCGKPYKKDEGWGPKYSKLNRDEYLKSLNSEREQNGKN